LLRYSNAEANTTRMHSQPGHRKNPKVVQSRRPKTLFNQSCHNAKHSATTHKHISVATQKYNVQSAQLPKKQANESITLLENTDAITKSDIVKHGQVKTNLFVIWEETISILFAEGDDFFPTPMMLRMFVKWEYLVSPSVVSCCYFLSWI